MISAPAAVARANSAVRVVGDHVGAEGAGRDRPAVFRLAFPDRAEHDAAAGRPGQLRVVDALAVAVDHGLLEAERVDEEADQGPRVAGPQGGPHLRWRGVIAHDHYSPSWVPGPDWTFRNSSASQVDGGHPASSRNSRARWAWS